MTNFLSCFLHMNFPNRKVNVALNLLIEYNIYLDVRVKIHYSLLFCAILIVEKRPQA